MEERRQELIREYKQAKRTDDNRTYPEKNISRGFKAEADYENYELLSEIKIEHTSIEYENDENDINVADDKQEKWTENETFYEGYINRSFQDVREVNIERYELQSDIESGQNVDEENDPLENCELQSEIKIEETLFDQNDQDPEDDRIVLEIATNQDNGLVSNKKPYSCSFCKQKFAAPREITIHLDSSKGDNLHYNLHSTKERHTRQLYDEQFLKNYSIFTHQLATPSDHITIKEVIEIDGVLENVGKNVNLPFSCHLCNERFAIPLDMTRHLKGHHEQIPCCAQCDKSFSSWHYMTKHLKRHLQDKLHPCNKCQKIYPTLTTLKRHLRMHSNRNASQPASRNS